MGVVGVVVAYPVTPLRPLMHDEPRISMKYELHCGDSMSFMAEEVASNAVSCETGRKIRVLGGSGNSLLCKRVKHPLLNRTSGS